MTPEKTLEPNELIDLLSDAGWTPDLIHDAFRTAFFESSLRPDVTSEDNRVNVASYGLFQINPIWWRDEIVKFLNEEVPDKVDEEIAYTEPTYYSDTDIPVLTDRQIKLITDPFLNAKFAKDHIYTRHGWEGSGPDGTKVNAKGEPLMNPGWTSLALLKFAEANSHLTTSDSNDPDKAGDLSAIRAREEESKDLWRDSKGPELDRAAWGLPLNPLKDKYPISADGSYKFFNEVPTDRTTSSTPPFDNSISENPEGRPMEEPQSAFTNPDTFVPQFVRDGTSQQTDPRQAPEFQPNFIAPNTVQ